MNLNERKERKDAKDKVAKRTIIKQKCEICTKSQK